MVDVAFVIVVVVSSWLELRSDTNEVEYEEVVVEEEDEDDESNRNVRFGGNAFEDGKESRLGSCSGTGIVSQ
jgi:hypothetical protein